MQTDILLATLQMHAVILSMECYQDFNFRFEGLWQWQTFMTFHCMDALFVKHLKEHPPPLCHVIWSVRPVGICGPSLSSPSLTHYSTELPHEYLMHLWSAYESRPQWKLSAISTSNSKYATEYYFNFYSGLPHFMFQCEACHNCPTHLGHKYPTH